MGKINHKYNYMKHLKLFVFLAAALSVMMLSSCKKQSEPTVSAKLSVEITDIKDVSAKLSIICEKGDPTLVRYLAPTLKSDVIAAAGSMGNKAAVETFITRNGNAVTLPYNVLLKDLMPETEYVVGVVAFNSSMKVIASEVKEFTTLDMNSMFEESLGDPSGAGDLTENIIK